MATTILTPDRFEIGQENFAGVPYEKNGLCKSGGYKSGAQYSWFNLVAVDLSAVTPGSTIQSVTIDVNIASNNATNPDFLYVFPNSMGPWVDDGSTVPSWAEAPFGGVNIDYGDTQIGEVEVAGTATGTFTIPTGTELVAWFQGVLDGSTTNYGLSFAIYTEFYAWYSEIDTIQINIEWDGTVPPSRRRVMIIS